jgi:hypothetical protein
MKMIFFLIAFCLVSVRYYFSWAGKERQKRGVTESDIVIKSDNFYEEINYSGKFQLSEDEGGFKSISPGGYFKFRKNEIKVKAESDLRGEIEYFIYDGKNKLSPDGDGKLFISTAIKEMIYWGYDADQRMERVYQRGGVQALLSEVDSIKTDQVKVLYLNRLFAIDSLHPGFMPLILQKVANMGSDQDKVNFLTRIPVGRLNDASNDSAYFEIIKRISSDVDKANALRHIINQDSVAEVNTDKILILTGGLNSDVDKDQFLRKMIDKGLIKGSSFDTLLTLISKMGSDVDKAGIYKELINQKNLNESQWIKLLYKISLLGSDYDKANLLVELALLMPQSGNLKINYQKAAKTLNNDNDYGRVMRALQ